MGMTVNLIDIWEPFKAAKLALSNTLDASNLKEIASNHGRDLAKLIHDTNEILNEGHLTKSYILDNVPKVLALARQCNVVLRWHLLHTGGKYSVCETVKKCKQVRDSLLVDSGNDPQKVLQLLLNTAQFENKVCDLFKTVLNEREAQWTNGKAESLIRLNELVEVFAGSRNVMRVKKNENLKNWFELISKEIDSLNVEETSMSARKIAQLIQALEEVQAFQQMTHNLGIKQLAMETCDLLRNMLNAVNVRDTLLVQMQIIGDFSYGWLLVDHFTSMIQSGIKESPALVNKLRSVFLKLSSAMEFALLRINQANDGNLPSVSEHYSHQLVLYVRKVLQVIPREVFSLMSEIASIQTSSIPDVPPRLEKDKLRDYAALDARFEVAKQTYEMSVFSTGLLRMQSTLVGIIRVDPKELLEEGVRKELEIHMTHALENGLIFNSKVKLGSLGSALTSRLDELGKTMEGNKKSFEYIQDYLGINGTKMWQEELKKVIGWRVEQECRMLRSRGATLDGNNSTFLGRLCKQLMQTTDPK
ncbi:Hereditary spastic paraplegia protein strumpellin [Nesidiocoris tenuis]|uniref:Hereditary spastic paraplegia protein strumpellin n=1 Tax=Nesidiocoris tenuis TaxID=355587 RepID=A0ABN7BEV1_9HEMI|nr:Hereditary spastic paraplegia protein strumpellin [Nesidiocoris tenuis]